MAYVLAVKRTEQLITRDGGRGTAEQLIEHVPAERWLRVSAGHGANGRRWYDWTVFPLIPAGPGAGRWLLVRRTLDGGELAFYACHGPAGTPLATLVRVAGTRWTVEESFQSAKARSAWTTTRSAAGQAGTGTPSSRCSPTRSSWSPVLIPTASPKGASRPEWRPGPVAGDRPRGSPAARRPRLAPTQRPRTDLRLVALAPPPPATRPTSALPKANRHVVMRPSNDAEL